MRLRAAIAWPTNSIRISQSPPFTVRRNGLADRVRNTRAQLSFAGVRYSNLRVFLPSASSPPSDWDAIAEGQVTIDGPLQHIDDLGGEARLTRLEFTSVARPGMGGPVTLKNEGPIVLALNKSVVNVKQARLTGPSTDIAFSGTAASPVIAP